MHLSLKLTNRWSVLSLLLLSLGLNSCKKSKSDEAGNKSGPAKVIIKMLGVDENSAPLAATNGIVNGKLAVNSVKTQTSTIPFDNDHFIVASLVPAGAVAESETKSGLSTNAIKPPLKTAAATQTPLAGGVIYKVFVYDENGAYVADNTFFYGQAATPFTLDAGKSYTFVAFSVNSAATVPFLGAGTALSSAVLNNVAGDFMYFKTTQLLNYGDNNLNIVMKHLFSQITTNITLDPGSFASTAKITAISGAFINPATDGASIKLFDGTITSYGNALINGASVNFPSPGAGVTSITSDSTLVINQQTTTGTLKIASMTIGGTTKNNLLIPNLNITPGQKYNLNLTLQVPQCTVKDSTNFNLVTPNSPRALNILISGNSPVNKYKSVVFNITGVGGGFTMDFSYGSELISLLGVTGQTLMHPPLQLDDDVQHPRTIEFADGDKYGVGGVPTPQLLTNGTKPIIRVEVDAAGIVSMFGIKASSTDGSSIFYQLIPAPGYSFNTIRVALSAGQNQITVDPTDSADPSVSHLLIGRIIIERFVQCTN